MAALQDRCAVVVFACRSDRVGQRVRTSDEYVVAGAHCLPTPPSESLRPTWRKLVFFAPVECRETQRLAGLRGALDLLRCVGRGEPFQ